MKFAIINIFNSPFQHFQKNIELVYLKVLILIFESIELVSLKHGDISTSLASHLLMFFREGLYTSFMNATGKRKKINENVANMLK